MVRKTKELVGEDVFQASSYLEEEEVAEDLRFLEEEAEVVLIQEGEVVVEEVEGRGVDGVLTSPGDTDWSLVRL